MAAADPQAAVRALNRLLQAEYASVLRRLGESTPFISWASADESQALADMIQQESEHIERLISAILDLRGVPAPRRVDTSSAEIHYCELHSLIPRILADKQHLIGCYEQALADLKGSPAASVAGRILTRHRQHLEALQSLFSGATG